MVKSDATIPGTMNVLIIDNGEMDTVWPYLRGALVKQLRNCGCSVSDRILNRGDRIRDIPGIGKVSALVTFGVQPDPDDLVALVSCRVIASETGHRGLLHTEVMREKNIAYIDGARGRGQSCAEVALALTVMALRRIPYWYSRAAEGGAAHPSTQFCDNPEYVNGTIDGKTVAVVGLGDMGMKLAVLFIAFGAQVIGVDSEAPETLTSDLGIRRADLFEAAAEADVVAVADAYHPIAVPLLDSEVINILAPGTIVVSVASADMLDTDALRGRVCRNELFWAVDGDGNRPIFECNQIRSRTNLIHLPDIASRTHDTSLAVAQIIANGVSDVLCGRKPARSDLLMPKSV